MVNRQLNNTVSYLDTVDDYIQTWEGNYPHRVSDITDSYQDEERKYLEKFKNLCETGFNINWFTGLKNDHDPVRLLTHTERKLILSVIQWLGSNVGSRFVESVISEDKNESD